MGSKAMHDVEVGQRYREVERGFLGRPMATWTVDKIIDKANMPPCARLVCDADGTLRKTLSLSTLTDKRRFARVTD